MSSPYHTHAEFEAARLASTEEAFLALPRDELLLSYQANALAECSRHTLLIVEKGRRIGFTWGVLAPLAVRTAASARGQGGMDFLYISYSKDMTREFMDACAMWSKAFAMAITAIDNEYIFEDQDEEGNSRNISASRIQFASGFEIIALPSAPRTIRGKQGVVAIDEAAHLNDLEAVAKAAMALRMWGGRVIIVSTHNGADNPFNEMLNEVRSGKRKGGALTISFNDAIAAGLYERVKLVTNTEFTKEEWIADARGGYTEDQQAEEFDCIPSQGAGSLIPLDKIMACTHDDAGKPELYAGGLVGVGRDVAIRKDLSVIHAVEAVSLVLWLRERWLKSKASFREQDIEFARMLGRSNNRSTRMGHNGGPADLPWGEAPTPRPYRVAKAKVDQTGMGEKVVEDAIEDYGDVVEGVLFTPATRLDLGLGLLKVFEDERIRIPNIPALIADIRAIKRKKGVGNVPQLVETGSLHADEFWALALAVQAAGTPYAPIDFQSAGSNREALRAFGDQPAGIIEDRGFGAVDGGVDSYGY